MTHVSAPLPSALRIGHLTYRVVQDDAVLGEHSVRSRGDFAGWSHSGTQQITLGSRAVRAGGAPLGPDYVAETLLHEVLHSCLRVAACDPDADARAGLDDVEERAVSALSGPLLAALRDNPQLIAFLLDRVVPPPSV